MQNNNIDIQNSSNNIEPEINSDMDCFPPPPVIPENQNGNLENILPHKNVKLNDHQFKDFIELILNLNYEQKNTLREILLNDVATTNDAKHCSATPKKKSGHSRTKNETNNSKSTHKKKSGSDNINSESELYSDINSENEEALFVPVSTLNRKRRIISTSDNKSQKSRIDLKENITNSRPTNKEIFNQKIREEQTKILQASTSKQGVTNTTSQKPKEVTTTIKKDRVPPITMIQKEHYNSLITVIKKDNIKIHYIKNKSTGLEILPVTTDDYRKLTNIFDHFNEEYFTFPLKEEKNLKIVIRGIPECINIEDIKAELQAMKFNILKISRMNRKIDDTKIPLPMIFAELPLTMESKEIFNITHINYLKVIIEPLRVKKSDIIQCHHCQGFGHTQTKCHLIPKCIKCTDNHTWKECPKTKNDAPQCTNCEGSHPANYRGCPIFKQQKEIVNRRQYNNRIINNPAHVRPNISYANITNNNNQDYNTNIVNNKPSTTEIYNLLLNMQKTISSLIANNFHDNIENFNGY